MKGYDEIKDIIVNRLGLRDMAAYKAYCDTFHNPDKPRIPTHEEIDLLCPDAIDNRAFWQVADELFSTDPVSNCQFKEPLSVEEANRNNLGIYHADGFTGFLEMGRLKWSPNCPLLEIGPGYGAFRNWVRAFGFFDYYAADVRPRIEGVDRALPSGRLSDETKARRYGVVLASNVFQHLSVRQRRAYYRDVVECLVPEGAFLATPMATCGAVTTVSSRVFRRGTRSVRTWTSTSRFSVRRRAIGVGLSFSAKSGRSRY